METKWGSIRFINSTIEYLQNSYLFNFEVFLGDLSTKNICVELYADATDDYSIYRRTITEYTSIGEGVYQFSLIFESDRPATDFTARIIPVNELISIPLECPLILWEH